MVIKLTDLKEVSDRIYRTRGFQKKSNMMISR